MIISKLESSLYWKKTDVNFEDVSGYPCLEIDFIEDLENARKLF